MVLPRKCTSALGPQAAPGEGNCQISADLKVRSDMQAWAGCLSHPAGLPGLSGSCDPKDLVLVFDTPLNLTRFQKRNETSGYILLFKTKLGLSSTCSKNV